MSLTPITLPFRSGMVRMPEAWVVNSRMQAAVDAGV